MTSNGSTRASARAILRGALAGRGADAGPRLVPDEGGSLGSPGSTGVALRDGLTVGRARDAGLRLRGREVSRLHARVLASGDGFALLDRSKNGVRVNGRRVRERAPLAAGDRVELGGVALRVVDGDRPPHPDPLPRGAGEKGLDPLDRDLDLDRDPDRDPEPDPDRRPASRLPLVAAGLLFAAAALILAL